MPECEQGRHVVTYIPRCNVSSRKMELSTATKTMMSGPNMATYSGPFFLRHHDISGNANPDATMPYSHHQNLKLLSTM